MDLWRLQNIGIEFENQVNPFLLVVILAIAVTAVILTYLRLYSVLSRKQTTWIIFLRILLIIIVLGAVFRPRLSFLKSKLQKSCCLILFDTSKSMGERSPFSPKSKLEIVKDTIQRDKNNFIRRLSKQFIVRIFEFSKGSAEISEKEIPAKLSAHGNSTDIAASIENAVKTIEESPVSGVILFTDGNDNAGKNIVKRIKRLAIPIYSVGLGNIEANKSFKDVSISNINSPSIGYLGEKINIDIGIKSQGYEGKLVSVNVELDGDVISSSSVLLKESENVQNLEIGLIPKQVGVCRYIVEIPPLEGELITQNNKRTFTVLITSQKIKVLYIEGGLRWEYKFLKRTLESDPHIDLTAFILTSSGQFYQQGVSTSREINDILHHKENLKEYDIIILGNIKNMFDEKSVSNIMNFTRNGGSFLILGGKNSFESGGYQRSELSKIFPVALKGNGEWEKRTFIPVLTPEASRHPILKNIRTLPALSGFNLLSRPKPGAVVLLYASDFKVSGRKWPVLIVQNYGEGKSATIATDSTWKWAFAEDISTYQTFWGQMVRWLCSGDKKPKEGTDHLIIYTNKDYYEPGEIIHIMASAYDKEYRRYDKANINCQIITPLNKKTFLNLTNVEGKTGEYGADYEADDIGYYQLKAAAKSEDISEEKLIEFAVGNPYMEEEDIGLNDILLKDIALSTGGAYHTPKNIDDILNEIKVRHRQAVTSYSIKLHNSLLLLFLFIILLSAEWLIRKKLQLI